MNEIENKIIKSKNKIEYLRSELQKHEHELGELEKIKQLTEQIIKDESVHLNNSNQSNSQSTNILKNATVDCANERSTNVVENSLNTNDRSNSLDENKLNESEKLFVKVKNNIKILNKKLNEKYEICPDDIEVGHTLGLDYDHNYNNLIISKFNKDITERYSRQIILDKIGTEGQSRLLNSSVLVVGCGGIGSPIIQYLSACGIGKLGLVDYDNVELSNLHRQVIHSYLNVGKSKVESAKQYVEHINPNIIVETYNTLLDSSNANDIVAKYDIVLDACDNVPTRYLINDVCLIHKKPLISGSALGLEGQLCIYNYDDGPCYRCIYPTPPPIETIGRCSENGVLGPVPGLIGILQAIECIKLILNQNLVQKKLLIYDLECNRFLYVKMRNRKVDCICNNIGQIQLIDYELFCNTTADDKAINISILNKTDHISVVDYKNIFVDCHIKHVLLDVRSRHEYNMVRLVNALQIGLDHLAELLKTDANKTKMNQSEVASSKNVNPKFDNYILNVKDNLKSCKFIFVVCRRGNDSQVAVNLLKTHFGDKVIIKNIKEGYHGWHKYNDNTIPIY